MPTTAWGNATVIDSITVKQVASGKEFATIVELLEDRAGLRLVRFAYSTGGRARRGPVTLRANDLERLKRSLSKAPKLREALCSALR